MSFNDEDFTDLLGYYRNRVTFMKNPGFLISDKTNFPFVQFTGGLISKNSGIISKSTSMDV